MKKKIQKKKNLNVIQKFKVNRNFQKKTQKIKTRTKKVKHYNPLNPKKTLQ